MYFLVIWFCEAGNVNCEHYVLPEKHKTPEACELYYQRFKLTDEYIHLMSISLEEMQIKKNESAAFDSLVTDLETSSPLDNTTVSRACVDKDTLDKYEIKIANIKWIDKE